MNISIIEEIVSHMLYLRTNVAALLTYNKVYKDCLSVILSKITNRYPFEATLKDGTRITLVNRYNTWYYARMHGVQGVEFDSSNDIISISGLPYLEDNMKLRFYGADRGGDVPYIFFKGEYGPLPVKAKTVIDVGGSIGDSAIYFSVRGANRVIALEPFPKNYEIAKKNVELNNLSGRITLLLAGCGGNLDHITINPELDDKTDFRLRESNHGIKIPLLTLEYISKQNNIQRGEGVLKMDCEGCEYDSILSASEDTLQIFSHIMIEYHHGYKNLKQKLEKSNFYVSVTRPCAYGRHIRVGYIYAKRMQSKSDNSSTSIRA